jgi:hypothetical protein
MAVFYLLERFTVFNSSIIVPNLTRGSFKISSVSLVDFWKDVFVCVVTNSIETSD